MSRSVNSTVSDALEFGNKLRFHRKIMNLTQREVAESVGVSLRTYSSYESGRCMPRNMDTFERISKVLNVDLSVLLSSPAHDFDLRSYQDNNLALSMANTLSDYMMSRNLSESDLDLIMKKLTTAYWRAKRID